MQSVKLKTELLPGRPKVSSLERFLLGARTPGQAREALWAYLFLSPWILGLIFFTAGPIIASLVLSFTEYSIATPTKFVGLENWRLAFTGDRLFWPSLTRTFTFSLIWVPIAVVGSLVLAILLNQRLFATNVFRLLFYIPALTPSVSLAILWAWILHPQMGPVNQVLGKLGLPQPGWMTTTTWAMPALIIMALWGGIGGNRMLIYLAGLQGVPQELMEAAKIDGAGIWGRFRHVTLPMISPVVFFNFILGVIGSLQVFTTAFVATQGGPSYATYFYALHLYNQAFKYFRLGYGCALAWILAAILIAFTYMQMRLSERWVYYAAA